MTINEKYSFKDFMGLKFTGVDASEFNNTEIKGSCFYQESEWDDSALGASPPDSKKDVFPAGMTGVTFTRCNIDNCNIPIGATVGEGNSSRKIRVQNDNEDWELAGDNKPVTPLHGGTEGKNTDPKNIPAEKVGT